MPVTLVWLDRDLRLTDHTALAAAAAEGDRLIPVYTHYRDPADPWAIGAASRWWLHHSLAGMDANLQRLGSRLLIRQGDPAVELARLARETGAERIYLSRRYTPGAQRLVERVGRALGAGGPVLRELPGRLLFEPESLKTGTGGPYRVFTPFWKACLRLPPPAAPAPAPRRLPPVPPDLASVSLESLELLPRVRWDQGLRETWRPGETEALRRLRRFADQALADYAETRDVPGAPGSSRLSPRLSFGELGPRQLWWTAASRGGRGAETFLKELGWRELAYHLLWHFPETADAPMDPRFEHFPWRDDPARLRAWQHGETGIPIVDAGMRELWRTGWMHNRVRMIAASLLTKNLRLPWLEGARWLWDTLVDADLANNTLGWQWVAGCGAVAAPYFRIFNPVTQGERFDPEGSYVRRWIPELARLPRRWVHRPWQAPESVLREAGIRLGSDYPRPIVDLQRSRRDALAAWERLK